MSKRIVFLVFLGFLGATSALAAPMRVAPAQQREGFSPVVAEIGQQLQELVTGSPEAALVPEETFGTRALGLVLNTSKMLMDQGERLAGNAAVGPQLSKWYEEQTSSEVKMNQWRITGQILSIALLTAFLARWLAMLALFPMMKRLQKKTFSSIPARVGGILARLGLMMIPVLIFLGLALFVIEHAPSEALPRFLVMSVVYALTLLQLVRVFLRLVLAPKTTALRLVPFSTPTAGYIKRWGDWYGGVLVFGTFLVEMARTLKVPEAPVAMAKGSLTVLVVGMTIAVILQKRQAVSAAIKGQIPVFGHHTLWQSLRLWFARVWHVLAIGYLITGWIVTMMMPDGGFAMMQQGTVGSLLILLVMKLSFHWASSTSGRQTEEKSNGLWRPVLGALWRLATWGAGLAGIGAVWGLPVGDMVASPWGQRVLGSVFSIGTTVLVLVTVYELLRHVMDRKLNRRDAAGNLIEADARSRTLLPMIHNAAIFILVVIAGLVTLSELGVDTGPLLAGAGILGVALGFGSQTLVKDFLTGLFILIEGTIAVGDVVRLGEHEGVVEGMSIRAVRLREMYAGTLYVIPFSEITRVANLTKGFAFSVLDVEVAYDSDLDKVMDIVRRVAGALQEEKTLEGDLLEPVEVLGVEELGSSSIRIRSRVKTRVGRQWAVRRAFLLRIKKAFDAEGVEIPFQHVVYVKKNAGGKASETAQANS